MTPEAQRIAIAEACPMLFRVLDTPNATIIRRSDQSVIDPLTDLNAMYETEKTLTDSQHSEFRIRLKNITGTPGNRFALMNQLQFRAWYSATATQRAEAFLRTIRKWDDAR